MADKKDALAKALEQIEKQFGAGAVMKLGDNTHMNVGVIPTGSLSLDLALGIGGVPKGRIVEIYGPESSGKTTVALHVAAEAQKAGGMVAFIDAVGFAPTLLRPPYGAVNSAVKHDTGRSVITWTIDTEDWKSRDTGKVVSYVQSLPSLDGEIVLLHSSYETTVEAVKILVPWLIRQGYQLVTVSELMAYYYGELLQPGQFYGYTYFTTHGRTDTPLALPEPEAPAGSEPSAEEQPQEPQESQQPDQQAPVEGAAQPAQPEGTAPSAPGEPSEVSGEPPADEDLPVPEKPVIPGSR